MPSFRPSLRMLFGAGPVVGLPLALGADGSSALPIIVSGVGALLTYVITIAMRVRAARKHARQKFLDAQGDAELADNNPDNDSHGRELKMLAAEEGAEAEALDDLASRRSGPRL